MVICLIHGAWHDESCWDSVRPLLTAAGHRVVAPRLPIDDPIQQLADYAEVAISAVGSETETVIVGHSMSSDVAAIVASRVPVRHVVYLCPLMAIFERPAGEPEVFREGVFDSVEEDESGRSFWRAEAAISQMYRALDGELAAGLAERLRPQCNARRDDPPITSPPKVPSTFLYTTEDEFFRPEWSNWAARAICGLEPVAWPGGHFPMLERPIELARFIESLGVA